MWTRSERPKRLLSRDRPPTRRRHSLGASWPLHLDACALLCRINPRPGQRNPENSQEGLADHQVTLPLTVPHNLFASDTAS